MKKEKYEKQTGISQLKPCPKSRVRFSYPNFGEAAAPIPSAFLGDREDSGQGVDVGVAVLPGYGRECPPAQLSSSLDSEGDASFTGKCHCRTSPAFPRG